MKASTPPCGPFPILTYHQIAEAPSKGSPHRNLYVSPSAFARQMALLKMFGYAGLSISELQPYLNGEKAGKVVGITFDDGYLNTLAHALPVLRQHGFSSTCYAVSSFVGKTNLWDEEHGVPQTPLMSGEELRQWIASGQEVGAHTRSHADLLQIDDASARHEIAAGKAELEAVLGQTVSHFSYPYGRFEAQHIEMVKENGFATATTTRQVRCSAPADLFRLPRIDVQRTMSSPIFSLTIATPHADAWEALRGALRKARQFVRHPSPALPQHHR